MQRFSVVLALAASLVGCATHHPAPPPAPKLHAVAVTAFGPNGPLGNAQVRLGNGGPLFEGSTNDAGYVVWGNIPITTPNEYAVWITSDGCKPYYQVFALGSVNQTVRVGDPSHEPQDLTLPALDCPPPPPVLHGRVRIENGRPRDDDGSLQWRGISEFDLIHRVRIGDEPDVLRRLDRGVADGRNVFRVFMRATVLFDLHDDQPGYWSAADRVVGLIAQRAARVELVIFCDAQGMSHEARVAFLTAAAQRYRDNPSVVFQIANEPFKNGWASALDPELLQLSDLLASLLGHRDFSIGDPQDGDDVDASKETTRQLVELARRSNILVLHGSRKGGAQLDTGDGRFRRWVDHLEGFYDAVSAAHQVNPNAWGLHDEPMGFASVPFVAEHERETDPEAALAGELTAQMIGAGFTYHYISAQNDGTPGLDLLAQLSARLPAAPSWSYRNDTWGGSATHGFTGWGKVRTWTNGAEAYVLATGVNKGSVTWANGYAPDATLYDGAHVTLWHARRAQ